MTHNGQSAERLTTADGEVRPGDWCRSAELPMGRSEPKRDGPGQTHPILRQRGTPATIKHGVRGLDNEVRRKLAELH